MNNQTITLKKARNYYGMVNLQGYFTYEASNDFYYVPISDAFISLYKWDK